MNYLFRRPTQIALSSGLLIATVVFFQVPSVMAQSTIAQSNKVESRDVVEWEPLARIDLSKPFKIEVKNTTSEKLEYLVSTQTNFRSLSPGEKIQLNSLKLPVFLNINATRSVGVKYLLSVEKNTVKVELKLTSGQGDTTLNIDDKGAIYLY